MYIRLVPYMGHTFYRFFLVSKNEEKKNEIKN